jgi:hypothetical protein
MDGWAKDTQQKHSLYSGHCADNGQTERKFMFFKMRNITPFMPCTFDENNWIILHLHHTRLFCDPINQVVLEIFWFLFKASKLLTPIVLNHYFESNWLLYHWKWSYTKNYPCKWQGHSSVRFPTDHKSQSSIERKQPRLLLVATLHYYLT